MIATSGSAGVGKTNGMLLGMWSPGFSIKDLFAQGRFANRPYPFFTASTISCRPCLASEKSIMVFSVS